MVKIKRLITSFVLVGLVMSFFIPDNLVSAEEVDGKCSITIDANVHDGNRHAEPTGDCKDDLFGWVDPTGTPMIAGAVTREVANGQVIRVSVGAGLYDLSITVIPKKEEPKPEPKPTPQPKPVKPKEPSNPSPSKPKANNGNSGNSESKGFSNNKNSGNTGGSSKGNNNDSNVKSNDNKNTLLKFITKIEM